MIRWSRSSLRWRPVSKKVLCFHGYLEEPYFTSSQIQKEISSVKMDTPF